MKLAFPHLSLRFSLRFALVVLTVICICVLPWFRRLHCRHLAIHNLQASRAAVVFDRHVQQIDESLNKLQLVNFRRERGCYTDRTWHEQLLRTPHKAPTWAAGNFFVELYQCPAVVVISPHISDLDVLNRQSEFVIDESSPTSDLERPVVSQLAQLRWLPALELLVITTDAPIDDALKDLRNVRGIRRLRLHCGKLSDIGLRHVHHCPGLEELYLITAKNVTDDGLRIAGSAPDLKAIYVISSKLSQHAALEVSRRSSLSEVYIKTNEGFVSRGVPSDL